VFGADSIYNGFTYAVSTDAGHTVQESPYSRKWED